MMIKNFTLLPLLCFYASAQLAEDSDIATLVGYGALFGVLHVLTGPDHIS
jgi:hypothetical protein